MRRVKDLLIPVNPTYDFDVDPKDQPEYVNPVTLNNMEIRHANAAVVVTDRLTSHMTKLAELRADRDAAQEAVDDFEGDLLRLHPAPTGAKTIKLIDAHIRCMAEQAGRLDDYRTMLKTIRSIERDITVSEAAVDAGKQVWQCIKLLGEHGQTHLSFVKQEAKQARYG